MSKIILGRTDDGELEVNLDSLLRSRMLVQANSGGGKSYLLRRVAEQLWGSVQVVIIDPDGEFSSLREKFGYVLAGPGGETPADPRSAALLARRLLELRASAVCDLYELRPHERHRWVRLFCESLVNAPKSLWHPLVIIVDEAHIFCPEKGAGESEAAGALIDLATRGRKRGFCAVFATQRLGKLRKDAAAELTNVLVGRTFMDVDRDRATDILGVARGDRERFHATIRSLDPGHFFAMGPALTTSRTLVTVGPVQTTHAELGVGSRAGVKAPTPAAVRELLPKLADLPKEAEAETQDIQALRSRVRTLERELTAAKAGRPSAEESARLRELQIQIAAMERGEEDRRVRLRRALDAMNRSLRELEDIAGAPALDTKIVTLTSPVRVPLAYKPQSTPMQPGTDGSPLPKGERAVLIAAAQYTDGGGAERDQISILTGYKRSSRDTYIQRLREKGYVVARDALVCATDAGIAALGADYEPLPTGAALREYWLDRLPEGERRVLQVVLSAGGSIEREGIDAETGYKRSSRDTYLQRLSTRKLIDTAERGLVRSML